MLKRILAAMLVLCLMVVMVPTTFAESQKSSDEVRWSTYWASQTDNAQPEKAPTKGAAPVTLSEMHERAEAIVNYEWVPKQDIHTWHDNEYEGSLYFRAGTTVKGVPYTLFTSEIVPHSLCSLAQFQRVVDSNYSVKTYCISMAADREGPVYGSCCVDAVCEIFGGRFMNGDATVYHVVSQITDSSYVTKTTGVPMSKLRPGDALSNLRGSHIVWIGDVTDKQIVLYEQTPPIARKVTLDKASNTNSDGYFVYNGSVYNTISRSKDMVDQTSEVPPAAKVLNVTGNGKKQVTITWSSSALQGADDARTYDVRIFKGENTSADSALVDSATGLMGTSYTTDLPDGAYTVQVVANNTCYEGLKTWGPLYTCSVGNCMNGHHYINGYCARCGEPCPIKLTEICPCAQFTDVPAYNNWAHEALDYCVKNEIMNGVSSHSLAPSGTATRAQLVTMLYRLAGSPETAYTGMFKDVANGQWYTAAVEWAASMGIVRGIGDEKFNPDGIISREQLATILYRRTGSPQVTGNLSAYADYNAVSSYAFNAIVWATNTGILNGLPADSKLRLAPQEKATRAQVAVMLMRWLED